MWRVSSNTGSAARGALYFAAVLCLTAIALQRPLTASAQSTAGTGECMSAFVVEVEGNFDSAVREVLALGKPSLETNHKFPGIPKLHLLHLSHDARMLVLGLELRRLGYLTWLSDKLAPGVAQEVGFDAELPFPRRSELRKRYPLLFYTLDAEHTVFRTDGAPLSLIVFFAECDQGYAAAFPRICFRSDRLFAVNLPSLADIPAFMERDNGCTMICVREPGEDAGLKLTDGGSAPFPSANQGTAPYMYWWSVTGQGSCRTFADIVAQELTAETSPPAQLRKRHEALLVDRLNQDRVYSSGVDKWVWCIRKDEPLPVELAPLCLATSADAISSIDVWSPAWVYDGYDIAAADLPTKARIESTDLALELGNTEQLQVLAFGLADGSAELLIFQGADKSGERT